MQRYSWGAGRADGAGEGSDITVLVSGARFCQRDTPFLLSSPPFLCFVCFLYSSFLYCRSMVFSGRLPWARRLPRHLSLARSLHRGSAVGLDAPNLPINQAINPHPPPLGRPSHWTVQVINLNGSGVDDPQAQSLLEKMAAGGHGDGEVGM